MTTGLYETELAERALRALQQQPRCEDIKFLNIYGLPNARHDQRNWEIANVDTSTAFENDIARGVIAVQYQLGRQFHLMMD